jgi:hypothetical protein
MVIQGIDDAVKNDKEIDNMILKEIKVEDLDIDKLIEITEESMKTIKESSILKGIEELKK